MSRRSCPASSHRSQYDSSLRYKPERHDEAFGHGAHVYGLHVDPQPVIFLHALPGIVCQVIRVTWRLCVTLNHGCVSVRDRSLGNCDQRRQDVGIGSTIMRFCNLNRGVTRARSCRHNIALNFGDSVVLPATYAVVDDDDAGNGRQARSTTAMHRESGQCW
jgi:hypothetical protein